MESCSHNSVNVGCSFSDGVSLFSKEKDWKNLILTAEEEILKLCPSHEKEQISCLVRCIELVDLTSLNGSDTSETAKKLCQKAINPAAKDLLAAINKYHDLKNQPLRVASVCMYPVRIDDCRKVLQPNYSDINIASVAGGFPAGQTTLPVKKLEIREAILSGANEIDCVINRSYALDGEWERVYDEVKHMKEVCSGVACMKTIIATGELGSLSNVYKASLAAMFAGSDFIKTSTGKESVNATIPVGVVMMTAIKDYYDLTGIKVGFKPAGGLKQAKQALTWFALMKFVLGDEWLTPKLFRLGCSSLLDEIIKEMERLTDRAMVTN